MKNKSIHIVEGVIEITQHRDRELIESSLVKTLHELIPCQEVASYYVQDIHEPDELRLGMRIDASDRLSNAVQHESTLLPDISIGIRECVRNSRTAIVNSERKDCKHAIYPLFRRQNDLFGVLLMTEVLKPEKHQGIVQGVLRIYQNFIALLDEGQRDKLTGLLNRQTFDSEIMRIISKPAGQTSQVVLYPGTRRRTPDENFIHYLAIFDIDHFKRINDTFGHVYGDEVLLLLSNLMKATFRKDDILFRYGGEEFIVVLRVPSQANAATALERFRKAVAEYPFPQVGQVTISIGYVQIRINQVPVTVTGRADTALYYAKDHGRNAIFNYEELVAAGIVKETEKTGDIILF